jgi:hypothetical protein
MIPAWWGHNDKTEEGVRKPWEAGLVHIYPHLPPSPPPHIHTDTFNVYPSLTAGANIDKYTH